MKHKLILLLKTLFASKGFSQKAIEGLADYLAPNLTEESTAEEMTAAITAIEPMTSLMQSEINRQVTEAKKPKPVEETTTTTVEETKAAAPAATTDPIMLELLNQVKTLAQGLAAVQTKEVATARKDLLLAKLADTPEAFKNKAIKDFGRMKFETDEEFAEFLTETETDAADFVQEQSNAGLGKDQPYAGFGKKTGEKEVSSAMKELIAERTAKAEAKSASTV